MTSLERKYGRGADELFARLSELSEVGGHAGITRHLHNLYRKRPDLQAAYPDLDGEGAHRLLDWAYRFARDGQDDDPPIAPELLPTKWLNEPAPRGGNAGVTRYLAQLHARTPSLQEAFPDIAGADAERFVEWARTEGVRDDPVLRGLVDGDVRRGRRATGMRRTGRGVNVVGFLRGELGLGEAARLVIAALDAAQVPLLAVGRSASSSWASRGYREDHSFSSVELGDARFPTNLVSVNPDQHWKLINQGDTDFLNEGYTIGFWWWEVASALPIEWRMGFPLVDEVWVGSEHVAASIRAVALIPVLKMRIPVAPAPLARFARGALGLPPGFLFLTMFDYNSTVERKNPSATIEAFKMAFAPDEGAALVVKSVGGEGHPEKRAEIEAAVAGRPDIQLVDRYVDAGEKNAMVAACDAYVSLHRAEGFGLPIAEAMYLSKPAIATGYSGNLEFMTPENSYLVDYAMRRIGPAAEPYYPADGEWADPVIEDAARAMRAVFEDREEATRRGQRAAADLRREFSPEAAGRAMAARLEALQGGEQDGSRGAELRESLELVERALTADARMTGGGNGGGTRLLGRRLALRLMRPFTFHQRRLNHEAVAAIDDAHARLSRARSQELLGRAQLLAQLRRHDARIAELEAQLKTLRSERSSDRD